MCETKHDKNSCEKPDRLKGEPEECSAEQIRQCHGEKADHPCCESSSRDSG